MVATLPSSCNREAQEGGRASEGGSTYLGRVPLGTHVTASWDKLHDFSASNDVLALRQAREQSRSDGVHDRVIG